MRILLLEDDEVFGKLIAVKYTDRRIDEVDVWGCVDGAVDRIKRGKYDLLLVDLELPETIEARGSKREDAGLRVLEELVKVMDVIPPTLFLTVQDFTDNYDTRIQALDFMDLGPHVLTYISKDPMDLANLPRTIDRVREKLERARASGRIPGSVSPYFREDVQISVTVTGTTSVFTYRGNAKRDEDSLIGKDELCDLVEPIYEALRTILKREWQGPSQDGKGSYRSKIDIPPAEHQETLGTLADAGHLVYQRIFYKHGKDKGIAGIGNLIRSAARLKYLKISIDAASFVIPWNFLYVGDKTDADYPNPNRFLGFKHLIEEFLPGNCSAEATAPIDSRAPMAVSLYLNRDIGKKSPRRLVEEQTEFWDTIRSRYAVPFSVGESPEDLVRDLSNSDLDRQLLYFFCHSKSSPVKKTGGDGGSCLILSNNARVTLDRLDQDTYLDRVTLKGSPLVFINACESIRLSPLYFGGWVRYFMAKGARGIMGTACDVPALFASEWATRFFKRFLAGEPIGQAVLSLRREFLERHHNVLGLIYSLYCSADTRVAPPLDNVQNL